MRFTISYLLLLLSAVAMLAFAAPVPEVASVEIAPVVEAVEVAPEVDLEKRGSYSGRGTWYDAGLGACGQWNSGSDKIVALPSSQYSGKCGKYVTIKNKSNGKSVRAMVRDKCPGCGYGSLDMSKGTFQAIGSLSTGVLPITWSFS